MDNKKNLRELFENSDEETLRRIAESHPVLSESSQKRVYKKVQQRISGNISEGEFSDSVHGVEVRRNYGVRRFASLAAALAVLIGGIGTGTYFISRSGAPAVYDEVIENESEPAEETEAEEEVTEEETEPLEETAALLEFDMADKVGIIGKMLNSVDYYDQVSGNFITSDTSRPDLCDILSVQCDVTEGRTMETITRFDFWNTPAEVVDGAEPDGYVDEYFGTFSVYTDGEQEYDLMLEPNFSGVVNGYYRHGLYADKRIDGAQIDPQIYLDWLSQNPDVKSYEREWKAVEDGVQVWREDCTNTRVATSFLRPTELVTRLLLDTDLWEISGSEEFLGRDCVVLAGDIHMELGEQDENYYRQPGEFKMLVDEETGCMLKCLVYNVGGELSEWYVTRDIAFDGDAQEVAEVDFSTLTDYTMTEEEIEEAAKQREEAGDEFSVNSSGETYGVYRWKGVDDYENAPDLIANVGKYQVRDGGYIRKDELFEKFGEHPCFDVMNIVRKADNTPEGTDLNIYDSEGENILYVITVY